MIERQQKNGSLLGWHVPSVRTRRAKPRWVLDDKHKRVRYSTGGDRHYTCERASFLRWRRKFQARKETHT